MPSQEVIDGLWKMGATIMFLSFLGIVALVATYINRRWF